MKILGTQEFSSLMYIACLTITLIAFGSLFATSQILFAQGGANETFFEAAVREAGQTQQQNQTGAAAPAAAAPPGAAEQQNQTGAAAPAAAAPPGAAEQQNQTGAAAPAAAPPGAAEQQNQTQSQNPFEQLGQAISRLFGGN
jgi:hypothetical protein